MISNTEENVVKLSEIIKSITKEKKISEEKLKKVITKAFTSSLKDEKGHEVDLHFDFDDELSIYRVYKIVNDVVDPEKEIKKDQIAKKTGKIKDDKFLLSLDTKNLNPSLVTTIAKYFYNMLFEEEEKVKQEKQYEPFRSRQGELVMGIIEEVKNNYCLVALERAKGYWYLDDEDTSSDRYRNLLFKTLNSKLKQELSFMIKEVKNEEGSVKLILTRSEDSIINKLLEKEVPQIKSGEIRIHSVLRIPSLISKIVVTSKNGFSVAKGACIGKDAERIKKISSQIYPERIDIAEWNENKIDLFLDLISPVKPKNITERGKNWEIIIDRDKKSLIFQHDGKVLEMIKKYLDLDSINVNFLEESEWKSKEDDGWVIKEIGTHKNINVRILKEMNVNKPKR